MRLPNFLEDPALNELRAQMGAVEPGSFRLSVNPYRFTVAELEQLIGDGIDVRYLDEVRPLPDRTLSFKDRRVLLFAREARQGETTPDPLAPFHFSNCRAVRSLREQPGFVRHAVSAREDGNFQVDLLQGTLYKRTLRHLPPCGDCLVELGFDPAADRFTVPHFFERYRRNLVIENQEAGGDTGRFPRI